MSGRYIGLERSVLTGRTAADAAAPPDGPRMGSDGQSALRPAGGEVSSPDQAGQQIPISGGESSSLPAGDDAKETGGTFAHSASGNQGTHGPALPPPHRASGHDLVSVHITQATAVILSALAAERGVSVGGMVTVLTVDAAEAIGLGALARELADRPPEGRDAARETGDIPDD